MKITLKKTEEVDATITVEVEKADYVNEVENSLKDLRKNIVLPGFRKGMAPPSLLRQKYGKSVLAEEINKLVSQKLSDYIAKKEVAILGEPLPANDQTPVDFDKQEDFVFIFDVGLAPDIEVQLTKEDHFPYYRIQVTEEMIDKQIERFKIQLGTHEPADNVEGNDIVKGRLVELDEQGEPKAGGIAQESAVLMPLHIKNEEVKAKFDNAAFLSSIIFNPHTAYDGDETELASFLNIKKEEVKDHTGNFSYEIKEITRFKEAELDQKLFDKVLGEGTVDSIEAFREKIKENLTLQLTPESDYKFILDARKLLEEKASDVQLPDAFLKRWLLASDPKRTPESLEEEYPKIANDLKFHLIKEHLIEIYEITIEENELLEYARQATRAQFAQFGMTDIPDDYLEKYSQEMLSKKETYRSLGDQLFEAKLIKVMKEQVTLDSQEVSVEDFNELIKTK